MVRLGAHDLSVSEAFAEDYEVVVAVVHPEYSDQQEIPSHDIALLQLRTEAGGELPQHLIPVCLPPPGFQESAGTFVKVAGWGRTSEGGRTADRLQEVGLEVGEREQCEQTYRNLTGVNLGPGVLCAGHQPGGRDACQGDSGGGLLAYQPGGAQVQLGIVSAGIGCARRDLPGQTYF